MELGDPNRHSLYSGVESCEVLFKLGGPASELGNLGGEVRTQHGAGAAQLQAGPESRGSRDESDERAREHQDNEECSHACYTVAWGERALQTGMPW